MEEKKTFRTKLFTFIFNLIILSLLAYGIHSCYSVVSYYTDIAKAEQQAAEEYAAAFESMAITAEEATDFSYTIKNGEVTITGYKGSDTNVCIPSAIDSFPVTTIGHAAFANMTTIHSVTLPVSVTTIDDKAFFGCLFLQEIYIPEGLKTIGERAFEDCTGLTSIQFPNTLTYIHYKAFCSSGLTSLEIPSSCAYVGAFAFAHCYDLEEVTLSPSLDVSSNVFYSSDDVILVYN